MAISSRRDAPILFWATVALVVLLPLPLGAIYQWSWALMALVMGVVLAFWSARVALGQQDVTVGLRGIWWLLLPFALCILWIMLQSSAMTPDVWHHPLWQSTAEALQIDLDGTVSLNPFRSSSGLARLLAYGGIFWISLQYCRRAARARQVLLAVTYAGCAYALYGLLVYLTGFESLLFFRRPPNPADLSGTFVNRDTFAAFAGLALVCASGLILVLVSQAKAGASSRKERLLQFADVIIGRGWPLLASWLFLLVALLLTHSRIGFLSTAAGLVVLVVAVLFSRTGTRRLATAAIGTAAVLIAAIGLLGGAGTLLLQPLGSWLMLGEGSLIAAKTMEAIHDAGMLGTGFGTFEEAFRFYRSPDIASSVSVAHTTYLENILELGWPAAMMLFAVFAAFFVASALGVNRRRRDAVYPAVGLAVTALVAVQSTVGFSLQIPAITALYMLIMGAACAQCWSSRRSPDPW